MKGCGMAVPTKEDFDAWLTLATMPIQVGASLPSESVELTIDDAAEYLRQADADRQQRWRAMRDLPAWRWLTGQREFVRAVDRVFGSRRPTKRGVGVAETSNENETDRFRARAQRLFDITETHARRMSGERHARFEEYPASTLQYRARDLRREIEREGTYAFDRLWYADAMRAVAEYLEGNTAAKFVDAAAEIKAAANAARDAVARYVRFAEALNGADFRTVQVRGLHFHQRRPFDVPDLEASPIGRRKDARGDERLFVYRMFVANRSVVRSAKPEAIADLMCLEGFRHQYETRTIERLCKRFAELHKRP